MKWIYTMVFTLSALYVLPGEDNTPQPYWLAVTVADLSVSVPWYQKHLGFKEFDRIDMPKRKITVVFLKRGDFIIEMGQQADSFAVADKMEVKRKSLVRGYFKFGFMVNDLDGMVAKLRKAGVAFHGDPFDDPRFGVKTAIIKDVDGNLIQLFQKLEE